MIGITDIAGYVPRWRLDRAVLVEAWGAGRAGGARAVAGADEDAVTLAVAAAAALQAEALAGVERVVFSSSSPPLADGECAPMIAAALGLPSGVMTHDQLGGRSLLAALGNLLVEVPAGGGRSLLCAGECQLAEPGEALEPLLGDAGAALLVGTDGVVAELAGRASVYDETLRRWRRAGEPWLQSEDNRYAANRLVETYQQALELACTRAGVGIDEIVRAVLPAPSPRIPGRLARAVGLDPARIVRSHDRAIGDTAAVSPALGLAAALAGRAEGELVAVGAVGRGVELLVLRATDRARTWKAKALDATLAQGTPLRHYARYLRWRGLLGRPPDAPPMTNVLLGEQAPSIVRLRGGRCRECEQTSFPLQRVCSGCGHAEGLEDVALSRHGEVFTFTMDHLTSAAADLPLGLAVVELTDGARLLLQVTDCEAERLRIGLPVEAVFRRLHEGGGRPNYAWKCRPAESGAREES